MPPPRWLDEQTEIPKEEYEKSRATSSGWKGCAAATKCGLAWLGGGTWRSAVAGGRSCGIIGSDLALNDTTFLPLDAGDVHFIDACISSTQLLPYQGSRPSKCIPAALMDH